MQRKPTANTRGPIAEEKRYHQWIKESNYCVACRQSKPVYCHHAEGSTFKHKKILVGHWYTFGLCEECDNLVTLRSRRAFTERFGPQSVLWLESIARYVDDGKMGAPAEVVFAILDWGR